MNNFPFIIELDGLMLAVRRNVVPWYGIVEYNFIRDAVWFAPKPLHLVYRAIRKLYWKHRRYKNG